MYISFFCMPLKSVNCVHLQRGHILQVSGDSLEVMPGRPPSKEVTTKETTIIGQHYCRLQYMFVSCNCNWNAAGHHSSEKRWQEKMYCSNDWARTRHLCSNAILAISIYVDLLFSSHAPFPTHKQRQRQVTIHLRLVGLCDTIVFHWAHYHHTTWVASLEAGLKRL